MYLLSSYLAGDLWSINLCIGMDLRNKDKMEPLLLPLRFSLQNLTSFAPCDDRITRAQKTSEVKLFTVTIC